jgi:pimeloyl-ACP methyl ester carboxylesterase
MIYQQPVVHELRQLRPPVLLVFGAQDRTAIGRQFASPEAARRMGDFPALANAAARVIPDVRLARIDDWGHLPHIEQAAQFQATLNAFLHAH